MEMRYWKEHSSRVFVAKYVVSRADADWLRKSAAASSM
jgi:hypothetical protein